MAAWHTRRLPAAVFLVVGLLAARGAGAGVGTSPDLLMGSPSEHAFAPASDKSPAKKRVAHRVRPGESLWTISRRYGVPLVEVVKANGIANPTRLMPGRTIWIPGAEKALSPKRRSPYRFQWPLPGRITSRFGRRRHPIYGYVRMHKGIDIKTRYGAPVRAAASGVVTKAGRYGGYGRLVEIRHDDGTRTRYGHNSRLLVRRGERVAQGQVIARAGSTGVSTGSHVHFEIVVRNRPVNPLRHLP